MDPAALMAMMGGQAKPEPWSKTVINLRNFISVIFSCKKVLLKTFQFPERGQTKDQRELLVSFVPQFLRRKWGFYHR